jgi:DNA-binding CsgD family transcriptional regulator/GAF domain-containing protein
MPATKQPRSQEFAEGGAALAKLAGGLLEASSFEELERTFVPRFGRLVGAPMYGFYTLEADGGGIEHSVAVNVSDAWVASYKRMLDADPLVAVTRETGQPAYNLALMSAEDWEASEVYRGAYAMHRMRHVLEVPIVDRGRIIGSLGCAATGTERGFAASDLQAAAAVADLLALSIRRIRRRADDERIVEQAFAVVELTGAALAVSDPGSGAFDLNDAARHILGEVLDGEARLPALLARSPGEHRFSRRAEVPLANGETALLHSHSQVLGDGRVVTALELKRPQPELDHRLLAALTPRETEVAVLVVAGLSDREIADRLYLSRYTVQQYVKRIYRALGVDSRVALTRLLLGAPIAPPN